MYIVYIMYTYVYHARATYSQKPTASKPKPKPSAEELEPSRRSLRIQKIQPNGEPMKPPPPPPAQVQWSAQLYLMFVNFYYINTVYMHVSELNIHASQKFMLPETASDHFKEIHVCMFMNHYSPFLGDIHVYVQN